MKRPLAYLTAAWSGEPDVDMELAAHYCRLAYEAGFSPICPLLYPVNQDISCQLRSFNNIYIHSKLIRI